MPSNHTEHYELSQWEPDDKVLHTDFNADNAAIDAALAALDGTVSKHTTTLSSHTTSIAKLGNCQVYTTTYVGNGERSRSYSFPGYPVYVYIRETSYTTGRNFMRGLNNNDAYTYSAQWSSRGLSLSGTGNQLYYFNSNAVEYYVFALLDMSK